MTKKSYEELMFKLAQTDFFLEQERIAKKFDAAVISSQRTEIEKLNGSLYKFHRERDKSGKFRKKQFFS